MASDDCTDGRATRDAAAGFRVRDAMVTSPKTVPADGSIGDLRAVFANSRAATALLVDGPDFVGVVHRDAVPSGGSDERPARALLREDVPTIDPDAPLSEALTILDESAERRLVVVDRDGRRLRGLLVLTRDRNGFCQD